MQLELLTPKQAAEYLQFHPVTLARWRARGLGPPYITIGDQVRYKREDVQAWLDANRRNGSGDENS